VSLYTEKHQTAGKSYLMYHCSNIQNYNFTYCLIWVWNLVC